MTTLADPLPARRPDLLLMPAFGQGACLVEDRASGERYRLGEEEFFLLSRLDGTQTARELCAAYQARFGAPLSEADVGQFLDEASLFLCAAPGASAGVAAEVADYERCFSDCAPLDRRARQVI